MAPSPPPRSSLPWRILTAAGAGALALVILFEEWGWAPLARLMAALGRLPFIARVERRVAALPAPLALAVFFVPMLLLLPFKFGALWLIAAGRVATGVLVFVGAKIAGTGVVARLFVLTQPQLMQLHWFARGYRRWVAWKDALMARVRTSPPWRLLRLTGRRLRRLLRRP